MLHFNYLKDMPVEAKSMAQLLQMMEEGFDAGIQSIFFFEIFSMLTIPFSFFLWKGLDGKRQLTAAHLL